MSQSHEKLSPEEFKKLQVVFEQAIALPHSEQAQLIREIGEEHPRIVGPLQAMLRHDAPTEPPASQDTAASIGHTGELDRSVEGYELLEEIGRGGMGVVYKAHQLNPDRVVALKMIRVGRFASELDIQRFAVEIDAIAKLEHANIVSIYEIGSHHGEHFFTMQFVEGSRLDEYLASDESTRQEALEIFTQVCDAVAYCHDRGIVHRDLKPSNILLDEKRAPKLTDFGLAKHLEKDSNLTRTGDLMGTPGFMAPEQVGHSSKNRIDARADVYSLGAILYKILTGKPPIDVADVNLVGAVERVHSNDIIAPRLLDRWVARDLETICMKCLDARPENRYRDAGEVADELRRYADGEPISARPASSFRRLLRWSRQQPGLAVTWLTISTFYLYHLTCLWREVPGSEGLFNWVATGVAIVWGVGAYCFQKLLVRTQGASWPLFGWVSMEVALLTLVLATGWAARSPLVIMYLVLVAASVLRFQPVLIAYVTSLCVTAYAFQVWRTSAADGSGIGPLAPTEWVPMGLGILCIGLIQYLALRRSRNAIELVSSRRQ